jgi:hypothetical protein
MAPSVSTPHSVQDHTNRFAVELGDSGPTAALYVRTTRALANDLLGTGVDSDQPVYFVVLSGNFELESSRVPAGQPSPVGSEGYLIIEVSTGQVLDFGLSQRAVALSLNSLGEVRQVFSPR